MDLADQADKQIEDYLANALARTLAGRNASLRSSVHASNCNVCDEPIPSERSKALPGCTTCVDCAHVLEQANRLIGKNTGSWWW
jgi:phage/conjugal plasmid C-4 type zinc finger TraR family protein